jgi:type IV secretory pathway VirB4 component
MFGAVGMRAFLHNRITPFPDQRTIEAARAVPPEILSRKLKLTTDQTKAVLFQLDEYGKYYQNIEEERSDVARHGIEAIRECLNDDQRKIFDQTFAARR